MDVGIEALRRQLREAVEECSARGLVFSAKWAAEQLCSLPAADAGSGADDAKEGGDVAALSVGDSATPTLKHRLRGAGRPPASAAVPAEAEAEAGAESEGRRERWQRLDADERDRMALGKSLFDVREFERVAFMLQGCRGPRAVFLRL
ncbi:hypothetical protein H4R26_003579, partial [Coemansia thaxteri]